jgi:hypothetical protein
MVILNFKQNVKSVSNTSIEENINNVTSLEFICKLDVKNKIKLLPKPKPKKDIGLLIFTNNKVSKKKCDIKKNKYVIEKNKNDVDIYDSYDND